MRLSERDMMTDLLLGTKSISNCYHQGVLEAAHDSVRNTFIQINNEELNFQKQIFDMMHDRGWYYVQPANMSAAQQPRTSTGAPTGTSAGITTGITMGVPQQMSIRDNFMDQRSF